MKRIIDKRKKEKFMIDDEYLNGQARLCGWQATLVYNSICRHANINQESFPSIKLMMEELAVGRNTIIKGIKNLEKYNVIEIEKVRSKNGKWLNNSYTLQDRSVWKRDNHVPEKDVVKKDNQVPLRTKPNPSQNKTKSLSGTLRKQIEGNTYKETHLANSNEFADNNINYLIGKFKPINPTYEKLFKNTTQRKALERLVDKFTFKKVIEIVETLPVVVGQKYAPVITTPLQLEDKLGQLLIFIKNNNLNSNVTKI
jgi:hypothetical protein